MKINVTLEILDDKTEHTARENIVRFQRLIQEALDRGFPVKHDHMANVLIVRFSPDEPIGSVEVIRRVRYVVALVNGIGQIKSKHSTHNSRDLAEQALDDAQRVCVNRLGWRPRVLTEDEYNRAIGDRYALV